MIVLDCTVNMIGPLIEQSALLHIRKTVIALRLDMYQVRQQ